MSRTFRVRWEDLGRALRAVTPWMSTDPTRYHLLGVCFEVRDRVLRLVATNGHGLAIARVDLVDPIPDCEIVAPAARVKELIKECRAKRKSDLAVMEVTIVDGAPKFPPWRQVVPKDHQPRVGFFGASAEYLALAGESFAAYGDRGVLTPMRLDVYGGSAGGEQILCTHDAKELEIVIMTTRL